MSAQFAPVAGLQVAEWLEENDLYGNYHLLLAHDILRDPVGWGTLFEHKRQQATGPLTVIVDNSIIELGKPLPPADLVHAVTVVGADYLILPDKIDDTIETIKRSAEGLQLKDKLPPGCSFLGVVQGSTFRSCLDCAEALTLMEGVEALAVPRGLPELFRSRYELTKEVSRIAEKNCGQYLPIHLLGFSQYLEDDLATARLGSSYGVMGIDSAVPVREGLQGRRYNYETNRRGCPKRPEDYLDWNPTQCGDSPLAIQTARLLVKENLAWVRSQIG